MASIEPRWSAVEVKAVLMQGGFSPTTDHLWTSPEGIRVELGSDAASIRRSPDGTAEMVTWDALIARILEERL